MCSSLLCDGSDAGRKSNQDETKIQSFLVHHVNPVYYSSSEINKPDATTSGFFVHGNAQCYPWPPQLT
jgi:hypothetical protein